MSASAAGRVIKRPARLEKQLEFALEDDSSHVEGEFAFGTTLDSAPNPGLQIDSLGLLSLPMTPGDVESIKSVAARAPFGKGEESIIDSTVRDTWEIDASRVTLKNPGWVTFLNGVVDMVWKGLGVAPFTTRPKCELYKLLLYEKGSQYVSAFALTILFANYRLSSFLPHQE